MDFIRKLFKGKEVPFAVQKSALLDYLPADSIILEAGVCDGDDTEEFAKLFPKGHIHGFEALPHYQKVAGQRVGRYANVTLYPFALDEVSGALDFHVSTLNGQFFGSGSLLTPKLHKEVHPHIAFDTTITVDSISIDDWANRYRIPRIDFMWLDLQGAEIRALTGAEKMLKTVRAIFMEVSLIETYEGVPLYGDVKEFLSLRGFNVEKEFLPYKDMGNVLFVKH